ncbi:hypothetical protein TI39_contig5852g00016 [Zymoseptoria brevis]|uniref:Uncharacterized protein n=1 Tax=Zymoseptoria brevis TaxID=1047168 RepID=A0A0F4G502_9PEZI|nr:hypothetical protein TI39_contig5852g00016 [Zymoseptoria brevis]
MARKSYMLSVEPVDLSLTDGTNIPAPLDTPPITPLDGPRSRTHTTGGPLTSHPTHQVMPGAFPPSPEPEVTHNSNKHSMSTTDGAHSIHTRNDSLLQQSPTPHDTQASSPTLRRPTGVRRIFSMSSLRHSFNSSRTSLNQRPGSSYQDFNAPGVYQTQPPSTVTSPTTSMQPPSALHTFQDQNKLRKKRSSSWFRRQSGFFSSNDEGVLEVVSDDMREKKRTKSSRGHLPMLPEISTLTGDEAMEGSIGWDEEMFKRW